MAAFVDASPRILSAYFAGGPSNHYLYGCVAWPTFLAERSVLSLQYLAGHGEAFAPAHDLVRHALGTTRALDAVRVPHLRVDGPELWMDTPCSSWSAVFAADHAPGHECGDGWSV